MDFSQYNLSVKSRPITQLQNPPTNVDGTQSMTQIGISANLLLFSYQPRGSCLPTFYSTILSCLILRIIHCRVRNYRSYKLPQHSIRVRIIFITMSYLCLGPISAGKTLLLTCLQNPDSVNFTSHSVPSVGTNLFTIKIPPVVIDEKDINVKPPPPPRKRDLVQVREVGGCLAPIWRDYLNRPVDKVIYVVDTSNLCQISAAGRFQIGFLCLQ